MKLPGKVCIITGSAMGQGKAAARLFAREGARIVVTDIIEELGVALVEEIRSAGGKAVWYRANAAEEEEVASLVAFAVETFGRLDVMYNNAGACRFGPVADSSTEDWEFTLRHELTNVFYGCKYALRQMLAQEPASGVILNTASGMGVVAYPKSAAHMVTKAGVIALTKSVARDYGRRGVRCNSISPGFIATEGQTRELAADENFLAFVRQRQVQDDIGRPDDVAHCALYLVSDEASFVNGANFILDGGSSIGG